VQNAKATELADILGNIFQSRASARAAGGEPATAGATAAGMRGGTVAPGLTPVQIRPPGLGVPVPGAPPTTAAPQSGDAEGLALVDGGSLEIIADDIRNALVVLATPEQYRMVESAVRKLDVVPLQVLIEARILEVALRDDLSYGVEWFFHNNDINSGEGRSRGTLDVGDAGIGPLAPGFAYTIIDTADQVRLALNLLSTESDVNVLSSPSLMVLDNQTATINVGDEIPVPARQSTSNIDPSSPTVNEITFRQTGITLSVTPRVSSSGLVTMEIRQEVATAAATTTSNIDAPTIQNRAIDSVVAVNSGETIVLGGLMQTQQAENESGIPGLRRIPGIGKLFGATSNEESRTELLVLITPRVVRNRDDVRSITEEFRQKLPQLQQLEAEIDPQSEG
jgi:general secretion pathway protein D